MGHMRSSSQQPGGDLHQNDEYAKATEKDLEIQVKEIETRKNDDEKLLKKLIYDLDKKNQELKGDKEIEEYKLREKDLEIKMVEYRMKEMRKIIETMPKQTKVAAKDTTVAGGTKPVEDKKKEETKVQPTVGATKTVDGGKTVPADTTKIVVGGGAIADPKAKVTTTDADKKAPTTVDANKGQPAGADKGKAIPEEKKVAPTDQKLNPAADTTKKNPVVD